MRYLWILLSTVALSLSAFSISSADGVKDHDKGEMSTKMTKHYDDSLFKVTKDGSFSVEVRIPEDGLEMGVNSIDLIVHSDKDKDVAGAAIKVSPWMPEMDHGVGEVPEISERGGGLYTVNNLMFSMTGTWELRIDITSGKVSDSIVITLPMVGSMGHMHTMKAPDASEIDTVAMKMSKNKKFMVSYKSDVDPIPLNKIISWTLTVKTKDKKPVTGANIKVVGDMPEHGHGFPTVPEVTEELGDGKYLVEGIKFSMPGWWVVNFHVMAGGEMDQAAFNLLIK